MEPLPEIPTDKSLRDMYKHTLKHSRTGPFSSCIKDSIAALNFHHNQLKINYNADARNKLEFAIKELESLAVGIGLLYIYALQECAVRSSHTFSPVMRAAQKCSRAYGQPEADGRRVEDIHGGRRGKLEKCFKRCATFWQQ